MAKPIIAFHDEAEVVEIMLDPNVIDYDDSQYFGSYTLHWKDKKLVCIEVSDATVLDSDTNEEIGVIGSEQQEESPDDPTDGGTGTNSGLLPVYEADAEDELPIREDVGDELFLREPSGFWIPNA